MSPQLITLRRIHPVSLLLGLVLAAIVSRQLPLREHVLLNSTARRLNILLADNRYPDDTLSFAEIEKTLGLWVETHPQSNDFWRLLAIQSASSGDIVHTATRWQMSSESLDDLVHRGKYVAAAGVTQQETDLAQTWLAAGSIIAPMVRDFPYYQGLILSRNGDLGGALTFLQQAATLSDSVEVGRADIELEMAELYRTQAEFELALTHLDAALAASDFQQSKSGLVRTQFLKGEVLFATGDLEAALDAFMTVIQLRPEHYWALVRSGQISWLVTRNEERSLSLLNAAVALDSESQFAFKVLGNLYCDLGDVELALANYRKVLAVEPNDDIARSVVSRGLCDPEN